MTPAEVERLASSGAVAGLCPITEGNLGDGVADAARFIAAGGAFGIGTDSNVRISAAEELRQLEYSQRLRDRARNVIAGAAPSTGRALFAGAVRGGSRALGVPEAHAGIAVGAAADFFSLNPGSVSLAERRGDALLDSFVFAGGQDCIDAVWRGGVKVVSGGRHRAREAVGARYRAALARILRT
jgi:formimidoylglutamate deiminase